jgi:hypothetical protein
MPSLGCDAVWLLLEQTFRRNVSPHHQGDKNRRAAILVPSSPNFITLMMGERRSSESSFLTTATGRHIPEDGIHHSHRCENLKSYIALTGWAL